MKEFLIAGYFALYNLVAKRVLPLRELPKAPFDALNQMFDAVWVLTIPNSVARQESIRRELKGLKFEFVYGVEGKDLSRESPEIDIEQFERLQQRTVKLNEVACTWSHIKMHQRVVDEGLKNVLIFEDDAVFVSKRSRWISYILERLPLDWELLYLGYRDGELRGPWIEFLEGLGKKSDPSKVVSRSVHRGLRRAAGHDFTHAYAVTNAGAKKLLQSAFPIRQTADGYLEEAVLAGRLKAYSTVPKLFIQLEDLGSSIHGTGPQAQGRP